ncbi:heterodisulfide reductase-related iron-sulfur binding cluster [soil metagenome]
MTTSTNTGHSCTADHDHSTHGAHETLRTMDYAIVQQCMHCGMCLPTCPTYDATHLERNSPRGRISLMRAIADGKMEATKTFGEEMYFCLGCLACETACPAGVQYGHLFEVARAEVERSGTLDNPRRRTIRGLLLNFLFTRPRLLRFVGRSLYLFQASGLQSLARSLRLTSILPARLRHLETQAPTALRHFSNDLIAPIERPTGEAAKPADKKLPEAATGSTGTVVGVLTGCVQDIILSDINRDTVDVLLANGCEVHTPSVQGCCGSLHAHNGEIDTAVTLARRLIDSFDLDNLDAIITNAAGCGSHLKIYGRLLADDPAYAAKAAQWSAKLKDIHEYLSEIGFRPPLPPAAGAMRSTGTVATYHEACHLCHGQKITKQPREILKAIPGLNLVELPESTWCCGSAGIYNITQPDMAEQLQKRKLEHIKKTGATIVAAGNPGCHLQLVNGAQKAGMDLEVAHPISLLARAYRAEKK